MQFDTSQSILRDLDINASILQVLNESFGDAYCDLNFHLVSFKEARGLGIQFVARGRVVPPWSARVELKAK